MASLRCCYRWIEIKARDAAAWYFNLHLLNSDGIGSNLKNMRMIIFSHRFQFASFTIGTRVSFEASIIYIVLKFM